MNDEKLIDLVRSQPAIYDKTNVFYSNKHHVKNVWTEVAMEMQQTVPACQKRWRYLRDYFVRQLHMTQNQQNDTESSSLTGPGQISRKRTYWPLYDKMCFLKPFSTTRKSKNSEIKRRKMESDQASVLSVSSSNSQGEFNSFDYMTMYQTQYAAEIQQAQAQFEAETEFQQHSPELLPEPEPVTKEPSIPHRKRKKSEVVEELLSVLRNSEQNECDEHDHFFKSLLNSVRKIDEAHIMAFRTEVLQLVMKYRYMSRGDKVLDQNGSSSDVVVIDTGELNWRRNLNCF